MIRLVTIILIVLYPVTVFSQKYTTVFIEAESFENSGGWVIDQQFMDIMGSPFLMAHGLGIPVKDASTKVKFPKAGTYYLFVRTRNWVAKWTRTDAPGKFLIILDDTPADTVFGIQSEKWSWQRGGKVTIHKKETTVTLHDITGFNGRCDAIIFTMNPDFVPSDNFHNFDKYRSKKQRKTIKPRKAGKFDFVVVGGGMAGTCTAISAARLGVKVALIQNRPVLGGNNSSEVRVHLGARINQEPYPALGNLVNEIGPAQGGNAQPTRYYEDSKKLNAVLAEKNISLFLNFHANKVVTHNNKIESVTAQNIRTGEKLIFKAPLFADCTGDGTIGALAGAEFMTGRESSNVFGEKTAPQKADSLTMGASVQWFAEKQNKESSFPDIRWGLPWNEEKAEPVTRGDWNWETGMGADMINDLEHIRDYGLLVVFSNWSYIKNHSAEKEKFANEKLKWVAYITGKRESRRLVGDYILVEQDLTERRIYADGTAPATWSVDLHYPDSLNSTLFPGAPFKSVARHIVIYPYPIPFRCLYSKNINNLMMAGRDISVSHVALGTVRLMRTAGMMGEVIGMAASVCKNRKTTPRGVYKYHFADLEKLMERGVGKSNIPKTQNYNLGATLQKE